MRKILFFILGAIVLGITCGLAGFMATVFIFLPLIGIIGLFSLLILIAWIMNKGKIAEISGFVIFICFIVGLTAVITYALKDMTIKKGVNHVVSKLEEYKKKHKKHLYPKSLDDIGIKNQDYIHFYQADSIQKSFTLRHSLDGWHYREYSSKTGEWVVSD